MPAEHDHGLARTGQLVVALVVVATLGVIELVVGVAAGSLALSGDAVHLATDAVTLSLAWFAAASSRQPASAQHTFGHLRRGILVAAVNGTILLGLACLIAFEAIHRLAHPTAETALPVLLVALLSLAVNSTLARMLHGAGTELSMRSAFLHVAADALAAMSVIVAATVLLTTGWRYADPLASLLISGLIAVGAVRLLLESSAILTEGTPRDVDADAVRATMRGVTGVIDVHDLHIWSLDRNHRALSAHLTVTDQPMTGISAMLLEVERQLCTSFAIEHVTLQPECDPCVAETTLFCAINERHSAVHTATS